LHIVILILLLIAHLFALAAAASSPRELRFRALFSDLTIIVTAEAVETIEQGLSFKASDVRSVTVELTRQLLSITV